MTSQAAIAGPLEAGARVGLQLPRAGTCAAQVLSCDGRQLILELNDDLAPGSLEEGSVVDMFLSLSWGMYKWICILSCSPGERKAEVELLDAPMFIQRRLDPRVGVGLPAEVCTLRSASKGPSHPAMVADLSHGGLKLTGARPLRAGDVIEVTMELSATLVSFEAMITVMGRVVMAYPSPGGDRPGSTDAHVCFVEDQPEAIAAVDRFVAQQLNCRWK
ncbi:MAG: PilZ domain-containing protein [Acidimicrobiales bacterium]